MLIRRRLLMAAMINLLIFIALAIYALFSTLHLKASHKNLSQQTLPIIRVIEQMRFGVLRIVASTSEAGLIKHLKLNENDEAVDAAHYEEQELSETGISILKRALLDYERLLTQHFPDKPHYMPPIKHEADNLITLSQNFLNGLNGGASNEQLFELKEQFELSEQNILQLLEQVLKHENAIITERTVIASEAVDHLIWVLAIGIFLLTVASSMLAWRSSKRISIPLLKLKNAAERVTCGDLDVPIEVPQVRDEIGQLALSFQTMTQALRAQQAVIMDAHKRTENILQVMKDILITTDDEGTILKFNRAACEQLQYSEQELAGMNVDKLFFLAGERRTLKHFSQFMHDSNVESALINSQGNQVSALISLSRITSESDTEEQYLIVATNISERKVAEEKIHKLAYYDALTGLPNRSLFAERLKLALKLSDHNGTQLAVLFLDIDNFKQINDSLGHAVGDGMLREISDVLLLAVRDTDVISHASNRPPIPTISRHGGDEFLILLPDISDPADIFQVADRILQQVSINIQVEGHEIFTSMSIGIAIYPEHGENERLLIQNADTALYHAKSAGKNQYSVFEKHMNHSVLRHMDIENNLRNALANNEFKLYFQPQLDINTQKFIGMEALIRWHHPEWSVVSPQEFIPIAESNGLIQPIGEWVLREACEQWVKWQKQGYDTGKMSINLSASQFKSHNLNNSIQAIVKETGVDPQFLVLEITESVLMQDAEITHNQLQFIKDSGIRLSVDDFGTGYSSLSYLKNFSLDYLKVDRSFIRDIESSDNDQEIVRTIINMARNLNLELVAEGVETRGQLELLKQAGCHFMQGTLISKPIIAAEYERLFLSQLPDLPIISQLA